MEIECIRPIAITRNHDHGRNRLEVAKYPRTRIGRVAHIARMHNQIAWLRNRSCSLIFACIDRFMEQHLLVAVFPAQNAQSTLAQATMRIADDPNGFHNDPFRKA